MCLLLLCCSCRRRSFQFRWICCLSHYNHHYSVRQTIFSVRVRAFPCCSVFSSFSLFSSSVHRMYSGLHIIAYISITYSIVFFQSVITSESNTTKNIRNVFSCVWDCLCVVSNFCFPFPSQPRRISWKCSFILLSSTLIDIKPFETIYQGTACFSSRTQMMTEKNK